MIIIIIIIIIIIELYAYESPSRIECKPIDRKQ